MLCADQLRADALGCYGSRRARTPHIDALAAKSLRFADHHTVTGPCGPARTSLLTGQHAFVHRVFNNTTRFDRATPSLPLVLREVGVEFHVIGYTDTVLPPFLGDREGLIPGARLHRHFNLNRHGLQGWYEQLVRKGYDLPADPLDVLTPGEVPHRARYAAEDSDSAYVAESVMECLEQHRDEDFVVFAGFLRPHPPFVAPAPYDTLHSPSQQQAPLPEGQADHPYFRALREDQAGPPEDEWRLRRALYHGLLTELDHQIGRVLDHLDHLGLSDNTTIVLTADHGDMLGDLALSGPRTPHVAASHVPLLLCTPGGTPGTRTEPTESVDLAPTLLTLLQAPRPPDMTGRDLLARDALSSGAMTEQDFRDVEGRAVEELGLDRHDCGFITYRTGSWTLVHFTALPPLLFDRRTDPLEQVDLARDRQHDDRALALHRALLAHRQRHAPQARNDELLRDASAGRTTRTTA